MTDPRITPLTHVTPEGFSGFNPPPEGWPAYWECRVAAELAAARERHAQVCAGLDGALLKVAQLHHPIPGRKELYCKGCDLEAEDYAIGYWPCLTWKLIEGDQVAGRPPDE